MNQFLDTAANQNHPLRILSDFLNSEDSIETAKRYSESRFVGYVLDCVCMLILSESMN